MVIVLGQSVVIDAGVSMIVVQQLCGDATALPALNCPHTIVGPVPAVRVPSQAPPPGQTYNGLLSGSEAAIFQLDGRSLVIKSYIPWALVTLAKSNMQ